VHSLFLKNPFSEKHPPAIQAHPLQFGLVSLVPFSQGMSTCNFCLLGIGHPQLAQTYPSESPITLSKIAK